MNQLPHLITDLALILGAAAITTLIFKKLKQPLVLGYIIAGLLVGPNFKLFPTISDIENIHIWADIGVIFMLFGLGLEFSFKRLLSVGGTASVAAVIEITGMLVLGYFTGVLLGWKRIDCIFLGGIIAISSTAIIIRAFDETGMKTHKFAKLVFGILVIEDLVALLILVSLSTIALTQSFSGGMVLSTVIKLAFFLVLWFLIGIYLVPTLFKFMKKAMNEETLLVTTLALCLGMVIFATNVGFSSALGAFIMGSILAETIFAEKIERLVKPVKDLFGAVFFVSVGMLIDPKMLVEYWEVILLIAGVVIFGKTFGNLIGLLVAGQPLKHAIQSGTSLAQIGEFSFIIATLGVSLNVTSNFLYPIAVAVSLITTFATPYMIKSAEPIYNWLHHRLPKNWSTALNRYSSEAQIYKSDLGWKSVFQSYANVIIINSVIIVALYLLSIYYFVFWIYDNIHHYYLAKAISLLIPLALTSPFLWALSVKKINSHAYTRLWLDNKFNRGPLVLLELSRIILAIFYVGFLINSVLSTKVAFVVGLTALVGLIIIFSKRLQAFYHRIETRFMLNLNARENHDHIKQGIDILPWDAHIAYFEVSPEAHFVGKTLEELALREKFGINISMIERGRINICIPNKYDHLYPHDKIAVIGTDSQLEEFKKYIEVEVITDKLPDELQVFLQNFAIDANSPLIGKTIRESGIVEKTKGLIVGLERNGLRILNPDSALNFEKGDLIWIVGQKDIIHKITQI